MKYLAGEGYAIPPSTLSRDVTARVEQVDHVIELVQHLLEPQLVDLVNDDEEHLVMFGSLRPRALQREQLVDGEIAAVGNRAIFNGYSLPPLSPCLVRVLPPKKMARGTGVAPPA